MMKTTRRDMFRVLFWGAVGGALSLVVAPPRLASKAKVSGLAALEGQHVQVLAQ